MALNFFIEDSVPIEAKTILIIKVENKVIDKIELTAGYKTTLTIKGKIGESIVEINGKEVRMLDSACPNKICVNTGWIKQPGELIVCLPNRVLLEIKGVNENSIDGISF